jgi:hypothetical protein
MVTLFESLKDICSLICESLMDYTAQLEKAVVQYTVE